MNLIWGMGSGTRGTGWGDLSLSALAKMVDHGRRQEPNEQAREARATDRGRRAKVEEWS